MHNPVAPTEECEALLRHDHLSLWDTSFDGICQKNMSISTKSSSSEFSYSRSTQYIYIYIYHQSLSFVRKNRVSYVPPQNSLSAQCFGIICAQFCTASYAWFPFEWFARELGLPVKYIVLGTAQFDSKDFFAMNPLCVLSIEKRRIFNIT